MKFLFFVEERGVGGHFGLPRTGSSSTKLVFFTFLGFGCVTAKIIFQGINSGLITYFFGQNKRGSLTVDRYLPPERTEREGGRLKMSALERKL
jgi:hypothetical protein